LILDVTEDAQSQVLTNHQLFTPPALQNSEEDIDFVQDGFVPAISHFNADRMFVAGYDGK
jgi:hypothetical protein